MKKKNPFMLLGMVVLVIIIFHLADNMIYKINYESASIKSYSQSLKTLRMEKAEQILYLILILFIIMVLFLIIQNIKHRKHRRFRYKSYLIKRTVYRAHRHKH